jgi:hypothetical protein
MTIRDALTRWAGPGRPGSTCSTGVPLTGRKRCCGHLGRGDGVVGRRHRERHWRMSSPDSRSEISTAGLRCDRRCLVRHTGARGRNTNISAGGLRDVVCEPIPRPRLRDSARADRCRAREGWTANHNSQGRTDTVHANVLTRSGNERDASEYSAITSEIRGPGISLYVYESHAKA